MFKVHSVERQIGGRTLKIETGKLAKQADGAVTVSYGDTMVLVTAVAGPCREDIDYFPLTVDYREKTSAAGKFPGGFMKREGRPTTKEILTARMIDRPIRPLFPDGYFEEVQVHGDGAQRRSGKRSGYSCYDRRIGGSFHQQDPIHRADRLMPSGES